MKNKIIKIIGQIFTVVCIGYIIYKVAKMNIDFSLLFQTNVLIAILILTAVLVALVFLNAITYRLILQVVSSKPISQKQIVDVYASSNIGKYLPGNFMHLAGRNVLGIEYGFDNKQILLSTFFEMGLKILVAATLVVGLSYNYLLSILEAGFNRYIPYILGVIIVLVVVAVIRYQKNKQLINTNKLWKNTAIVLGFYVALFTTHAISFVLLMRIFSQTELVMSQALILSGIYITSWLVGYLTPGSPGGIGVKEAVLVFLLAGIALEKDVIFVGLILRVCSILGDVVAFIINKIFNNRSKLEQKTKSDI